MELQEHQEQPELLEQPELPEQPEQRALQVLDQVEFLDSGKVK
jgi:hypothetical protein